MSIPLPHSLPLVTAAFVLVLSSCQVVPPEPTPTVTLTIEFDGTGSGSVTVGAETLTADGTVEVDEGSDVSLEAVADTGSEFTTWAGSCSGSTTTCLLTADADASVVATFDAVAVPAWTSQFGTAALDAARAVAVDTAGSTYVAGSTAGDLAGTSGQSDAFLRKLDADGNAVWTRQFGGAYLDEALAVAVDGDGNPIVAGRTQVVPAATTPGPEHYDGFVRAFDPDGNELWADTFGSDALEYVSSVDVDAAGAVVVSGYTLGDLAGTSAGGEDAFARKLSSAGAPLWTVTFGGAGDDRVNGAAFDGLGSIYLAGETDGTLGGSSSGGSDAFIRKVDGDDGSETWTEQFGTSGSDSAVDVAFTTGGDFYVNGQTSTSLDGTHQGGFDHFVRRFTAAPALVWGRQFGSDATDLANRLTVTPSGDVAVAGSTFGSAETSSAGGYDAHVRVYAANGDLVLATQFGTSGNDHAYGIAAAPDGGLHVGGQTFGVIGSASQGGGDAYARRFAP